jgi:hypothetical protein
MSELKSLVHGGLHHMVRFEAANPCVSVRLIGNANCIFPAFEFFSDRFFLRSLFLIVPASS